MMFIGEQEAIIAAIRLAVTTLQRPETRRWVSVDGDDPDLVAWVSGLGYDVATANGRMLISWNTERVEGRLEMPYVGWASTESMNSAARWENRKRDVEDDAMCELKRDFLPWSGGSVSGSVSAVRDDCDGDAWVLSVNVAERFARWATLEFPEWSFGAVDDAVVWKKKLA